MLQVFFQGSPNIGLETRMRCLKEKMAGPVHGDVNNRYQTCLQ